MIPDSQRNSSLLVRSIIGFVASSPTRRGHETVGPANILYEMAAKTHKIAVVIQVKMSVCEKISTKPYLARCSSLGCPSTI